MTPTPPLSAFIFPGQGAQQVGMGRDLYEAHPLAREIYDQADTILKFPLSRLCFDGPKADLDDTVNTQPALYVTSVALWRVAEAVGASSGTPLVKPAYAAGHSLGEYTALTAAGALPFEAGVRVVRARGEVMKAAGQASPGGMAAVLGGQDAFVAAVCDEVSTVSERVQVANYNCPGQVVISGAKPAVDRAVGALQARGIKKVMPLDVSIAAHSNLMASAVDSFTETVNAAPLSRPLVPVVANLTARPVESVDEIRAELVGQLTGSVRWTETVEFLLAQGVQTFIEIGPGNVLNGLVKRIARDSNRVNLSSWDAIREALSQTSPPAPRASESSA